MEQPGSFAEQVADRTVTMDRGLVSDTVLVREGERS
jgi:hypothetical protein